MTTAQNKETLLLGSLAVTGLLLALIIVKGSTLTSLLVLGGLAVIVLCLHNPESALYLLVFSMLLSPEFGGHTQAGAGGSGVTLRFDDILLALIGFSWIIRSAIYKDLGLFRKTPLNQPIFLYLVVCVIATATGVLAGNVRPIRAFFYLLKYFEYYFVFFMLVNHLRRQDMAEKLVIALLLTCFLVDIIALAQLPSGHRLSAPFEGAQGEPNTLGGYLVLMTTLCISLALYCKKRFTIPWLWGLALLNTVTMLFTRSRGSYLAFAVMVLALLALTRRKILVVLSLLILLTGPFILPDVVKERIIYTFSKQASHHLQVGNVSLDPSTSARIEGWQHGFSAVGKRPFLGYGVTGYGFVDSQFLLVLVDTGIIGFLAFGTLLGSLLYNGWRAYHSTLSDFAKPLGLTLCVGTLAMITHAASANTFIIVRIMEPFWFIAGLTITAPLMEQVRGKK